MTNKDNYYTCEKCKALSALKQLYIVDPPQILVVSLKRFEFNKKFKITKNVGFEESITIDGYSLQNEVSEGKHKLKYSLYAVIVHKGDSISTGHYICYCKTIQNNKKVWVQFSD